MITNKSCPQQSHKANSLPFKLVVINIKTNTVLTLIETKKSYAVLKPIRMKDKRSYWTYILSRIHMTR